MGDTTVCDVEDLNHFWSTTAMKEMHIKLVAEDN